ncbi:MAG: peptide-methionine (R)-S-oxide reductase MsrB [Cytophagales bacterium]|nr:peptide-methionine (R)-S-oxide reductase MsrB [Cytophagales bacterium]
MNTKFISFVIILFVAVGSSYCQVDHDEKEKRKKYEVSKSEDEWKSILSPEEFDVLRNKGTEYAFTGEYYLFKEKGIYTCAGCGNELFDSKTKYNSGSGWPSFYRPIKGSAIDIEIDRSFGTVREEILCSRCGGHLGHVFNDGPKPTGLRYCVNSISLDFKKK